MTRITQGCTPDAPNGSGSGGVPQPEDLPGWEGAPTPSPSVPSTRGGWWTQPARKTSWRRSVSASMPRLRPARLSVAWVCVRVSRAARVGVGASLAQGDTAQSAVAAVASGASGPSAAGAGAGSSGVHVTSSRGV